MADKPTIIKPSSSHLGAGIIIGSIIGIAAGYFLQSKKGKQMTKEMTKKAQTLQAKLMKELGNLQDLTKEKYEEVVDKLMDYYVKTQEVAKSELPAIRDFLLKKWTGIEKQLKDLKN